jgi:hypothetical protein
VGDRVLGDVLFKLPVIDFLVVMVHPFGASLLGLMVGTIVPDWAVSDANICVWRRPVQSNTACCC